MTARRIWTTAAAATARAFALFLILYELVNYSCHDSNENHCYQNRTDYCVHNYPPNCLCKISDDICFLLCVCAYLNVLFKLCAFLIRSNEHIDDKSDKSYCKDKTDNIHLTSEEVANLIYDK